ncbi:hypothetical protein PDE_03856 [Penicillium oxalicum 114-2]|uniref:RanBD1 domain-containing protein n=1 Tax=Penicillium oxalicum (strain 114-2 / CGMCC 5302) TaxID=933388 RepID=S7ZE39_PENO1|nr:hypothetical protein PDE_03856 [Penicillium oxalicum 114-2]
MASKSDEPQKPADATGGDARTPPSDNDERPVREQLKETTIDAAAVNDAVECASNGSGTEQSSGRKRSFEESRDEDDEAANNNEGPRKRSREATPEVAKVSAEDKNGTENKDSAKTMKEEEVQVIKKKRSLDQVEDEGAKKSEETETKRHRDNSQEREAQTANAFAKSAFGSAAASSPFASLGSSNLTAASTSTSEKPAPTSAFASSALGSFAGSETSPFGSFGASSPSVFKSGTSTSAFGSSSTSGFGSLKNGFAGVGGGFAAAAKTGGLSNFASPAAASPLGGEIKPSTSKPLGADDSADEGSDDDEGEGTNTFEADKTDERFYEQTISTGEEEEENVFSCKGKLFHFSGEWKERGVGTFKVNVRNDEEGKRHGRMIMRADGALRVMLNSPVFKGMTFGDAKNEEPSSKQIFLASNEEGRTVPLLLRVGNENLAKDLYGIIKSLLDDE